MIQAELPTRSIEPGTPMVKVIPPRLVEPYLTGQRLVIAGYVYRASDCSFRHRPPTTTKSLALGYEGSEFSADMAELFVLRWIALDMSASLVARAPRRVRRPGQRDSRVLHAARAHPRRGRDEPGHVRCRGVHRPVRRASVAASAEGGLNHEIPADGDLPWRALRGRGGPVGSDVVLFAACPPPEELGFEPATGHWRKRVIRAEVDALWESRPVGTFRDEPCMVLDDLGDRLHIAYLGEDAALAGQPGVLAGGPGRVRAAHPARRGHRADRGAGRKAAPVGPARPGRPRRRATRTTARPGWSGPAPPAPASCPSPSPTEAAGPRAASGWPTRDIFCELADLAAIPRTAYALETEMDGALCLMPGPDGYEVFMAMDGAGTRPARSPTRRRPTSTCSACSPPRRSVTARCCPRWLPRVPGTTCS